MITYCVIINLDSRNDLWDNLENFRNEWKKENKMVERIPGVNLKNEYNILLKLIASNRINLNGNGFRKNKNSFFGELGCFLSHYNSWKFVIDNNLNSCLILEDGIEFIRNDFNNLTIHEDTDILFINEEMNNYDSNKNIIGYGTQGYIITKKGAKKLMENCSTLFIPIDLQIRHLCNIKKINGLTIDKPFLRRKNDRVSSIDNLLTNNNDLNEKQDTRRIIERLLVNLEKNNINLDDHLC